MASSSVMLAPRCLAFLGLLGLVSASSAANLPPQEAPAYTGVYRVVTRWREKAQDPWNPAVEDVVTIAVANKQSRWDRKNDGSTQINDRPSRITTTFGGKVPSGTAIRTRAPHVGIGWEFGYVTVATATETEPEVLGTATIAGLECTRLRYVSEQYGEPEFCVTKSGVVLRFTNASSTAEASYEATSVTEQPPAPDRFTTPADLKVEERGNARRIRLPF
jgi:hypothetical protein